MLHFVLERARPLSDHVFFPRLYNLRRNQLRRTDGNPSAGSERLTPPEKVHNAVQSDQRSRRTLDIADHQLLACAYDELQEEPDDSQYGESCQEFTIAFVYDFSRWRIREADQSLLQEVLKLAEIQDAFLHHAPLLVWPPLERMPRGEVVAHYVVQLEAAHLQKMRMRHRPRLAF